MNQLAVVILAAGQSTRMRSKKSKLLHPLAGRPLIAYPMRLVAELQPAQRLAILGHLATEVRAALDPKAQEVLQEPQLGTGHALQQAQPLLQGQCQEVLVLYGDTPLLRLETIQAMRQAHQEHGAVLTLLSGIVPDPTGYGRVLRDARGQVQAVVEDAEASPEQRAIHEINSGILLFQADWLWQHLPQIPRSLQGEYYLTDLIGMAVEEQAPVVAYTAPDPEEIMGINTRLHLAQAEAILRQRVAQRLMLAGVTILDPTSTYIDDTVEIGRDSTIYPNSYLYGETRIGEDCVIGPNSLLLDSQVGDRCRILASVLEQALLEDEVDVGPFSHMRKGAHLAHGVHVGNFGEVKNAHLGPGVKMGHFSYIGDAEIGAETNIGAGTITCNYDGTQKHRTVIGKKAFIGSDTMLVAPVQVGDEAKTGAGAVVTHDVPPKTVAYGVPARVQKKEPAAD
ncbi:MAG: bifunctional UDP-N-acetylglucosamine diphosphorylase/glucosamine-1-phosphate N-acetyltransferase GlmU [Chloroflexia bacterium]|nr:bifunctional UDP-N-acetylglucosamine diphosphorylase/glucosamine-1-phosphate N-acetyltransferase GlmU [Chloroflexia bacterium]